MAVSVEDILARRTRLLFLDAGKAIQTAPLVAKHMAAVFEKNEYWVQSEVDGFTALAKNYLPLIDV